MSTGLIILRPSDTLKDAADAFRKNNIHHLPVVDEQGRLAGILSKSDFLRVGNHWAVFQRKKGMPEDFDSFNEKITIGEVMTRILVKLAPDNTISDAFSIFRENIFHAIPIVEKDTLVGLVTTFDLLKYAFQETGIG